MHIELDHQLAQELDDLAGPRGRSSFVRAAIVSAIERERRWRSLEASLGSIPDTGHEWDLDPAGWVRDQRRGDARRVG
jgi:hypothetical protein